MTTRPATILLLAIVAGFGGGAVSNRLFTATLATAQPEKPKLIQAEEFRVVDQQGKRRIVLALEPLLGWPSITLMDEKEEARIKFVLSGSPDIFFYGDKGGLKAIINGDSLLFYDDTGNHIQAGLSTKDKPNLFLNDEMEGAALYAGAGAIALYAGAGGKKKISLQAIGDSASDFTIWDREGNARINLSSSYPPEQHKELKADYHWIVIRNEQKEVIWKAPAD